MTIGHRQRILDLPEAGKPEGTCPECGPHGNRGAVTLFWSVVPCITCGGLADARAHTEAEALEMQIAGELASEGCEVCGDATVAIEPTTPGGRRVIVTVPYRHAKQRASATLPSWAGGFLASGPVGVP